MLFFHHLPYNYVLHSGKTVIQHVYDTHYAGVEQVREFVEQWQSLKGRIDEQRYNETLARLEYQVGHATEWRDAVCQWFFKMSGIPDQYGRVDERKNLQVPRARPRTRPSPKALTRRRKSIFDIPIQRAGTRRAGNCCSRTRNRSVYDERANRNHIRRRLRTLCGDMRCIREVRLPRPRSVPSGTPLLVQDA